MIIIIIVVRVAAVLLDYYLTLDQVLRREAHVVCIWIVNCRRCCLMPTNQNVYGCVYSKQLW